jgi:predicted RNase H-like HicB family nuclease
MRAEIVLREAIPELRQKITATIRRGDQLGFVGECLEVAVVTQGATVDETIEHLRGAIALHLDGEDPADFGLRECPTLLVTIDVQPSYARAS